jgi:hypothetical protein
MLQPGRAAHLEFPALLECLRSEKVLEDDSNRFDLKADVTTIADVGWFGRTLATPDKPNRPIVVPPIFGAVLGKLKLEAAWKCTKRIIFARGRDFRADPVGERGGAYTLTHSVCVERRVINAAGVAVAYPLEYPDPHGKKVGCSVLQHWCKRCYAANPMPKAARKELLGCSRGELEQRAVSAGVLAAAIHSALEGVRDTARATALVDLLLDHQFCGAAQVSRHPVDPGGKTQLVHDDWIREFYRLEQWYRDRPARGFNPFPAEVDSNLVYATESNFDIGDDWPAKYANVKSTADGEKAVREMEDSEHPPAAPPVYEQFIAREREAKLSQLMFKWPVAAPNPQRAGRQAGVQTAAGGGRRRPVAAAAASDGAADAAGASQTPSRPRRTRRQNSGRNDEHLGERLGGTLDRDVRANLDREAAEKANEVQAQRRAERAAAAAKQAAESAARARRSPSKRKVRPGPAKTRAANEKLTTQLDSEMRKEAAAKKRAAEEARAAEDKATKLRKKAVTEANKKRKAEEEAAWTVLAEDDAKRRAT